MTHSTIKEFDGGREVSVDMGPDFLVLEAGPHVYTFDPSTFLHAIKKVYKIALVIPEAVHAVE